jgi:hypothetical protein
MMSVVRRALNISVVVVNGLNINTSLVNVLNQLQLQGPALAISIAPWLTVSPDVIRQTLFGLYTNSKVAAPIQIQITITIVPKPAANL